ncbi:RidA family protein [Parvularcula bermudensis]|uniref:RidA family protein n=1 Tax=Parvularcula bermudensis TaxID=208216 RepID=UPI0005A0C854|nr:RidA family protein [Parvularcula bermudensis]
MTSPFDDRLDKMGIVLPEPAAPVASYVPAMAVGELLFVSGQIPVASETLVKGIVGGAPWSDVPALTLEEGKEAAKICAINLLAQVKAYLGGSLSDLVGCVKLGGFVACGPDFRDQPAVINGASDFMIDVMGDAGRHTRFAVGAPSLPLGVAVEIDGIFRIKQS